MRKIGFIGLGNMGRGMCGTLIRKGNEMAVYDVNKAAMEKFKDKAYLAENPADVIAHADYVFLSLPNSELVEATVEQLMPQIAGKTIVDTSTSFPTSTKNLAAKVIAAGGQYFDAAVMNGPAEAEAGTLDIYVGGDPEAFEKEKDLFESYSGTCNYAGAVSNGHLIKVAMNFIGLTEALLFEQLFPLMDKLGYDKNTLFDLFEGSVLKNWTSNFYTAKCRDRNYHLDFALALGTKDLNYMKKLYDQFNVPAFILDGALDFCRVALEEQKPGEAPIDFSYPCEKMYHLLGMYKD